MDKEGLRVNGKVTQTCITPENSRGYALLRKTTNDTYHIIFKGTQDLSLDGQHQFNSDGSWMRKTHNLPKAQKN